MVSFDNIIGILDIEERSRGKKTKEESVINGVVHVRCSVFFLRFILDLVRKGVSGEERRSGGGLID